MKTRITLIALCCLAATTSFSQTTELAYANEGSVMVRESSKLPEMNTMAPSFAGGHEALADYMMSHVQYPESAKRQGIEGTVLLEYYITEDGTIENITVLKSVSSELDKEAIRLVQNMPNWNPAIQNNQPVRVKYQQPVKFELDF